MHQYWDLITFPIEHERLRWEGREALLDVEGGSRLFVRVKLTGTTFVHRAQIPQVWVGETFARHVTIDDDMLAVRAYFDELPAGGTLYFGYGGNAELAFGEFDSERVSRLDRARLPKEPAVDVIDQGRDVRRPPG